MKLSIPHIKIGSAGIGFFLCLGVMIGLGIFLHINADKTLEARQDRIPMAEVILNQAAYTASNATDETTGAIEKDLPPVVDDLSDTIEVTPVETRTPLFDTEAEAETPNIVEDEIDDAIVAIEDDIVEELKDITKEVEDMGIAVEKVTKEAASSTLPPRIALIISDMGLSESATQTAIDTLPKGVTLAFAPYANNVDEWVKKAKNKGHDTLLSIPMEPQTFPNDDPGPNALLTSLSDEENVKRLQWALSQASGYVGIVNFMGSRFTASQEKMQPIMEHLKGKNLIVLDSSSASDSLIPSMSRVNGIPYANNDRFIDNRATTQAINEQLSALEAIAITRGQAIGIGFPYPVTFDRISHWSKSLESKGIILVPISDLSSEKASN